MFKVGDKVRRKKESQEGSWAMYATMKGKDPNDIFIVSGFIEGRPTIQGMGRDWWLQSRFTLVKNSKKRIV